MIIQKLLNVTVTTLLHVDNIISIIIKFYIFVYNTVLRTNIMNKFTHHTDRLTGQQN